MYGLCPDSGDRWARVTSPLEDFFENSKQFLNNIMKIYYICVLLTNI